jgi:putative transposase
VSRLCAALQVSRSGYYEWGARTPSAREQANTALVAAIRRVHEQSRQIYGAPRIHAELTAQGVPCGRHRVARLMRRHGIVAKMVRRWRHTAASKSRLPPAPNRLQDTPVVAECNQAWGSDLTFIPTRAGWLYLAVVIDLCSRAVVGWAMGRRLTSRLVCDALEMAIQRRRPPEGTVIHSDQGRQYDSAEYRAVLAPRRLLASMSRRGNCYDNAVVESFFHTLKGELVAFEDYHSREEAQTSVFEYVEVFYNRQRRHSALGYLSPMAFEAADP